VCILIIRELYIRLVSPWRVSGDPEYIYIVVLQELLYTASLPKLLT